MPEAIINGQDLVQMPLQGEVEIEFVAKRYVLLTVFERASQVVPSKNLVPVLKNFSVHVTPGAFRVIATDLEMAVIASTEMVQVDHPGHFFVPADKLLQILRESGSDTIHVQVSETDIRIDSGSASWTLRREDANTYPVLPSSSDLDFLELSRSDFVAAVSAVSYAAATDGRANLALIHVENGRMTASDGVRFQQVQFSAIQQEVDLPIGSVSDLLKIIRLSDVTSIGFGETASHLVFQIGGDLFLVNRLMTTYPDMEATFLAPVAGNNQAFSVSREGLLSAVRRVRITADPGSNAIVLRLSLDNVRVEAEDLNGNKCTDDVPASWMLGPRTVVVNHKFLVDALNGYTGLTCVFKLGSDTKGRKSPLLLSDEQTGAAGVIQQMRADYLSQD